MWLAVVLSDRFRTGSGTWKCSQPVNITHDSEAGCRHDRFNRSYESFRGLAGHLGRSLSGGKLRTFPAFEKLLDQVSSDLFQVERDHAAHAEQGQRAPD